MNKMPSKKTIISLALGSAFAVALGTAPIASAGESPFTTQSLNKGYMVASHHDKDGYGEKGDAYGEKKGHDKKYGEGRCGMSMADTDNDGRVSKEEHARHAQLMFEKMDANGDGYIDKEEANKMRKKHGGGHGHRSGDRSGYGGDGSASGPNYRDLQHMKPMGE